MYKRCTYVHVHICTCTCPSVLGAWDLKVPVMGVILLLIRTEYTRLVCLVLYVFICYQLAIREQCVERYLTTRANQYADGSTDTWTPSDPPLIPLGSLRKRYFLAQASSFFLDDEEIPRPIASGVSSLPRRPEKPKSEASNADS